MRRLTIVICIWMLCAVSIGQIVKYGTGGIGYGGGIVGYKYIPVPTGDLTFFTDYIIQRASDSLVYNEKTGNYDSNVKLLGSASNGYISAKSTNKLVFYGDTVPITCLFSNYNYADTAYFKMADMSVNTDSTENLPHRLTAIAFYDKSKTGIDSVNLDLWTGVPEISGVFYSENGDDGTGDGSLSNPYLTYATAAAAGSNIVYAMSGSYDMGGSSLVLSDTLIGVGNAEVISTASYAVNCSFNNCYLSGMQFSGGGGNSLFSGTNPSTTENCYFTGAQNRLIYTQTGDFTFQKNVVENSGSTNRLMETTSNNIIFEQNYIDHNSTATYIGSNSVTPGVTLDINYNHFSDAATLNIVPVSAHSECNIIGNEFNKSPSRNIINTNSLKFDFPLTFVGNSGSLSGYIWITDSLGSVKFRNNNLHIFTTSSFATIFDADLDFTNNVISVDSTGGLISNKSTLGATTNTWIRNNSISALQGGGATIIGDESDSINKISSLITENIFNKGVWNSHGVQVYNHPNCEMSYNYSDSLDLPYIFKGDSCDYSSAVMMYNIAIDGRITLKGINKAKVYGNTVYNTSARNAVHILANVAFGASGNELKNNIFYCPNASEAIEIDNSWHGTISDNNIIYNSVAVDSLGTDFTFTQWQATGQDANSYNTDPNFNSSTQLWPVTPTDADGSGVDLGAAYEDIMLNTSVWPDAVVKDTQDASWDLGAYKIE